MSFQINFVRVFFYCLLGTLLASLGIGIFNQPLQFCLIFAIVYFIEEEARSEYIIYDDAEDEE